MMFVFYKKMVSFYNNVIVEKVYFKGFFRGLKVYFDWNII